MKKERSLFQNSLWQIGIFILLCCTSSSLLWSQSGGEVRYLRIGSLHTSFSEQGAEPEDNRGRPTPCDGLWWPAEYGEELSNLNAKSFWIGTTDYYDPVFEKQFPYKVIGNGPRRTPDQARQVYPMVLDLNGKFDHPFVIVDGLTATDNDLNDVLNKVDDTMIFDRTIVNVVNTSVGVEMTRKISAFSNEYHDNYHVYEYVFKNTGIIDRDGTHIEKTLNNVVFHFQFRYALGGEAVSGYNQGWGEWDATWGMNTMDEVIGPDPDEPGWEYTAMYSYYHPHSARVEVDDWGCPNEEEDGRLAAVQYLGTIVLHADKAPDNPINDPAQPFTTHYVESDNPTPANFNNDFNQYNEELMRYKYEAMTLGHAEKSHAQEVLDAGAFADQWGGGATRGGYNLAQGYGPYTMEPGDSIRIVYAEACAGISRQKMREIGSNWLLWYRAEGAPELEMPNGTTTTDYDAYKEAWVKTGEDSLLQSFSRIKDAFENGFDIPQPPPPPSAFEIKSGGDRIRLVWSENAESHPNFDGYEIYRSEGSVIRPTTVYQKIFECDASSLVNTFDDTTARRGFNYYYYIQSKDDGSTNSYEPGVPMRSGKFYTLTNQPGFLRRPAVESNLDSIRVVPNPYDIRSRILQFGEDTNFDRIAFFNLPPECTIKIYTERGDLIWETSHDDGSGDELWDSQTSAGQLVVSGLYLAVIETPDGESIIRKIIIIR